MAVTWSKLSLVDAAETITGVKTFNDATLKLAGSTSGATTLKAPAAAGTDVMTLPSGTDTLVALAVAQTLTNKTLTDPKITFAINAQSGTTYTFVPADNGKLVTGSNGSATTFTVDTNANQGIAIGATISVLQIGAGKLTIAYAGGVIINAKSGYLSCAAQYSGITLLHTATDTWYLVGDTIA